MLLSSNPLSSESDEPLGSRGDGGGASEVFGKGGNLACPSTAGMDGNIGNRLGRGGAGARASVLAKGNDGAASASGPWVTPNARVLPTRGGGKGARPDGAGV
mmetsp:Transcript_4499/g.12597  ORF Transcript_4499/g.12597 Transcript_4499/m.12597 type:complete len:102 (-) Transcript_4499:758-1063(-)